MWRSSVSALRDSGITGVTGSCLIVGGQVCGRMSAGAGVVSAGLCRTPVAGIGVFARSDATSTMHRKTAQSAATRDGMVALVFLSCGTGDHLHEWLTFFMIKRGDA
jgi:hypothetical protein